MIIVAHSPSSVQRLEDLAKLAFGIKSVKAFVITKPSGAAAQSGIAEVMKLAYKLDKTVLVFPDLNDAIELLSPTKVYTISFDFGKRVEKVSLDEKTMLIVGASDPGLSKIDAQKGEPIYPSLVDSDVGPIAALSIIIAKSL